MGTVEALESSSTENSLARGLSEVVEGISEHAGSMAKRFARLPLDASPSAARVTGEQLGQEFAKTFTAALEAFKESAPAASEAEQGHAARELAGLAADAGTPESGDGGKQGC